jgi:hypothetical protein
LYALAPVQKCLLELLSALMATAAYAARPLGHLPYPKARLVPVTFASTYICPVVLSLFDCAGHYYADKGQRKGLKLEIKRLFSTSPAAEHHDLVRRNVAESFAHASAPSYRDGTAKCTI